MSCPRCGAQGYREVRTIGGKGYLYYVHELWSGGKRLRRRCYIGPINGYEHAERLLSLGLRGIHEIDYLGIVRRAVERYVGVRIERAEDLKRLDEELGRLIKDLRRLRERVRRAARFSAV